MINFIISISMFFSLCQVAMSEERLNNEQSITRDQQRQIINPRTREHEVGIGALENTAGAIVSLVRTLRESELQPQNRQDLGMIIQLDQQIQEATERMNTSQ